MLLVFTSQWIVNAIQRFSNRNIETLLIRKRTECVFISLNDALEKTASRHISQQQHSGAQCHSNNIYPYTHTHTRTCTHMHMYTPGGRLHNSSDWRATHTPLTPLFILGFFVICVHTCCIIHQAPATAEWHRCDKGKALRSTMPWKNKTRVTI